MANLEHLAIIQQGVAVWNVWRKIHPEIRVDLIGADFTEAKLGGVNLAKAYRVLSGKRHASASGRE